MGLPAGGGTREIADGRGKMRSYDRIFLAFSRLSCIMVLVNGGDCVRFRANASDIAAFLAQAQGLLAEGRYVFVPRTKNLEALADHGLTIADAREEILSLTEEDYFKGPKTDFDISQPGDIWEFKKRVDGFRFYVKLKIQSRNGRDILKCLSFHEDEF